MEDLCYIEFLMKIMIWLKRVLSVESKFFFFFFQRVWVWFKRIKPAKRCLIQANLSEK